MEAFGYWRPSVSDRGIRPPGDWTGRIPSARNLTFLETLFCIDSRQEPYVFGISFSQLSRQEPDIHGLYGLNLYVLCNQYVHAMIVCTELFQCLSASYDVDIRLNIPYSSKNDL